MIAKLIIASLLAGTSTASVGQDAGRSPADGSTNQWPLMHQCTLAVSKLAIKTKGTGAQRSPVGEQWDSAGWSRIDLDFAGSPDHSRGPTIRARGIVVKKPEAASGRTDVTNQSPIGVDCVTSPVTGDEVAQKATMSSFAFMSADSTGIGWSCSVLGSEEKPVFRIALLVPAKVETPQDKAVSWSWGERNSHVSIVARGVEHNDSWHVACSSKEPRNTNYDLAVLKKA
ncbi:MAG: hypothetical protein ABI853_02620 [Sphingomicrobium sp.]